MEEEFVILQVHAAREEYIQVVLESLDTPLDIVRVDAEEELVHGAQA